VPLVGVAERSRRPDATAPVRRAAAAPPAGPAIRSRPTPGDSPRSPPGATRAPVRPAPRFTHLRTRCYDLNTDQAPRSIHQLRLRVSLPATPSSRKGTSPAEVTETARPRARRTSTRTSRRTRTGTATATSSTPSVGSAPGTSGRPSTVAYRVPLPTTHAAIGSSGVASMASSTSTRAAYGLSQPPRGAVEHRLDDLGGVHPEDVGPVQRQDAQGRQVRDGPVRCQVGGAAARRGRVPADHPPHHGPQLPDGGHRDDQPWPVHSRPAQAVRARRPVQRGDHLVQVGVRPGRSRAHPRPLGRQRVAAGQNRRPEAALLQRQQYDLVHGPGLPEFPLVVALVAWRPGFPWRRWTCQRSC